MSALALPLDTAALARFGVLQGTEALLPPRSVLGLGWPELEKALPDRGLPRGVIELAARAFDASALRAPRGSVPSMRGGATTIAIAAMSQVHAASASAWCAWITPSETSGQATPSLYAPALARVDVDLDRLLVVRPPESALARTIVKVAASGAFELVVVDLPSVRALTLGAHKGQKGGADAVVVRKLALAAEEAGTTSLLLTNALEGRSSPWPVALRLEVERRPDAISVLVTKDRRGRQASSQHVVRLAS